ncbi:MAG: pentapeptide repeat-containing protein [Thermosynechococcaceae cyanobacterium]
MQPFNLHPNYTYRDLRDRSFRGQDLRGVSFKGSDLRGCDFTQAQLTDANFELARFGQSPKQLGMFWLTTIAIALPVVAIAIVVAFANHIPFVRVIALILGYLYMQYAEAHFTNTVRLLGNGAMIVFILILVLIGGLLLTFVPNNGLNVALAIAFFALAIYLVFKTLRPTAQTIPKNGTRFVDADLTRAKFRTQTPAQWVEDVDFTGAILAQTDFSEAICGPIRCDYYYRDPDRTQRHPPTGTLDLGTFDLKQG